MARKGVEEAKERLGRRRAVAPPDFAGGLSTGSTLLNLACTGRPDVGYVPGTFYYFVGDSNSGKSFLTLVAFAEACANRRYKDYRLIYDNPEHGAGMNLRQYFGKAMAERLEPPFWDGDLPGSSDRVEDFYLNLHDALTAGPCIYVLDSMDALSSTDEEKHFVKIKHHVRKEKGPEDKAPGSYGDGKAKKNSALLRQVLPLIHSTGSILIVISQTRDVVGDIFTFKDKTRSGGRALTFYAQVEIWSSVRRAIKHKVNDIDRHTGNACTLRVERSRFTGHAATVEVPIYYKTGVDDVGSCVAYLLKEGHWKKGKTGRLEAPEFEFEGTEEKLIRHVEATDRERELAALATQVWVDVEERSAPERKRRYE